MCDGSLVCHEKEEEDEQVARGGRYRSRRGFYFKASASELKALGHQAVIH